MNCYSFYIFSVLCHFIILYMASMEIVSFCRIIPLCNFQHRNHVHSITLISFQIILQNFLQILSILRLDDMHRLRTVTSLDVSAVAGHHAMPAALLFLILDTEKSSYIISFPTNKRNGTFPLIRARLCLQTLSRKPKI